jgi:hypothetical protein
MTLRTTTNNQAGAVRPLLAVHKTFPHMLQTGVENIEARWTLAGVHMNAFLWTREPLCRGGIQR